jgi:hypothetical protein
VNWLEVVGLIVGSSVFTALVNNLFSRRKAKADVASVLVGSAVDVVELKDEVIRQLRAEFAVDRQELRDEKKIYKYRLMPYRVSASNSNSKSGSSRLIRSGWKVRLSS